MRLKYEATELPLINALAPVFSDKYGGKYSTTTNEKRLSEKERDYALTDKSFSIVNLARPNRDLLHDFWGTTLDSGYNDFSIIDPDNKIYFDANWNDWDQRRRLNFFSIDLDIRTGGAVTRPVFAAYPMLSASATISDYLGDNDISLVNGALVSGGILRQNGYALYTDETNTVGASGTVHLESKFNRSTALFCQFKCPETASTAGKNITVVRISDGTETNYFELNLVAQTGLNNPLLYGYSKAGSTPASLFITTALTPGTWYDTAVTFDKLNSRYTLYVAPSGVSAFTRYLQTATPADQYSDTVSDYTDIASVVWSEVILAKENESGSYNTGGSMYIQNVFIFDGHLTSIDFDQMRRQCYLWNDKTEDYPK